MSSGTMSGENPDALYPQPHGGALKRGGTHERPGRPKMRDTVAGVLRDFMLMVPDKDEPGIIHALMAKALSGDVRAIELCLHYGIGKPTDKVEVSGPDGGPITHAEATLDDHEKRLLRDAVEALAGEAAAEEPEPAEGARSIG